MSERKEKGKIHSRLSSVPSDPGKGPILPLAHISPTPEANEGGKAGTEPPVTNQQGKVCWRYQEVDSQKSGLRALEGSAQGT